MGRLLPTGNVLVGSWWLSYLSAGGASGGKGKEGWERGTSMCQLQGPVKVTVRAWGRGVGGG